MSTDYREKEREFLSTLEEDTGRGLEAWMAAISAQRLSDKNEVIDWLRQQGFMFWKASWLERIHSNGGRPIYATDAPGPSEAAPSPPPVPIPAVTPVSAASSRPADPKPASLTAPTPEMPLPPTPPVAVQGGDDVVEALLLRAKALRPLARHILKEIARAVPQARFSATANYISITAAGEFAVLTISPRELKLGLSLPGEPFEAPLEPARFAAPTYRVPASITHMIVLTDARQINGMLMALIARSAAADKQ